MVKLFEFKRNGAMKLTKKAPTNRSALFVVETPRVELGSSESTIEPSTCLFSNYIFEFVIGLETLPNTNLIS